MIRGPDGGVSAQRVEPWKVQLFLAGTGLAMEDGVFEGLGESPAPRTERGEIAVEPGGVSGQIALTGPHLVDAASKELGETHKVVVSEGGREGVPSGRRGHGGPLAKEDGPGFLLHRSI